MRYSRSSAALLVAATIPTVALLASSWWLTAQDGASAGSVAMWRMLLRGLVSLACLGVAWVSFAGRSQDPRARLLSLLFSLMAIEFALPEVEPGVVSFWGVTGAIAYYLFTGAEFSIELHLASMIPRPVRRPAAVYALLYGTGFVVAVVGSVTFVHDVLGRSLFPWTVEQFDDAIHGFLLPGWALGLLFLLARTALRWPEREGRLQAGLVLLGVTPWVVYVVLSWALGYPGRFEMTLADQLVPLFVMCYPVAVFVAIFRYHLLDLETVVRRSLVYGILTGGVILTFYASLGIGSALLGRAVGDRVGSTWIIATVTVGLGLAFSPLRRATQRAVDRRFFPEKTERRERLVALAAELPALGSQERMGQRLVTEVRRVFVLSDAALFLTEREGGDLRLVAATGAATERLARAIEADAEVFEHLARHARPVTIEQLADRSPRLAREFRVCDTTLVVPLCLEERLIGLLLLGSKPTRRRIALEERELSGLVAHHAAAVFDNARLAHAASHEELTGLMRREAILAVLQREIERARRYGRPLTVALADVDHFKRINDTYGHLTGDRVLREVAGQLSGVLRRSDGIGRYGGEEFLCVFPETDGPSGDRLAEKLRAAIESLSLFNTEGRPIDVRVSMGLAELDEAPPGPDTDIRLLAAADQSLYRAKAAGRNRTERAGRAEAGPA